MPCHSQRHRATSAIGVVANLHVQLLLELALCIAGDAAAATWYRYH